MSAPHTLSGRLVLASLILQTALFADAPDPSGHWEGAIELPTGELQVKVDLEHLDDGSWQGTIDIPAQGAKGLPLDGIEIAGEAVRFAIRALERAGASDVTARELEGLNHLFQHAETGLVAEYGEIEETLAPEVLELVAEWIRERVSPPAP